ncbi:MAG: pyridoxamine 5'-phosphate oxidase family protein [Candidatus Omnitrophica bacterium]|nr:pyridoxamine 5'-phosphate oxidase family protein [Candidatus Omnitrophota bacterium]MDE2009846.1 pyridoxamine 5'-phosphate oxidase family protein [Candidatus Omnitrophota bacterium]MDE2214372.1 pyridoxamine 5'-phosphate oxidase family protein [Candidatus Omnitrophota bacterium]MDE2231121.1 pyridoxamine 5'-phosphate oxidase family protein [Candidatus Omnitrophota bacterium]
MQLDEKCKEVIDKTEWLSIVTMADSGPHLVAAWGYRLRQLGIQDGEIVLLPAGKYFQTEENLKSNPQIQLLAASSQVQRPGGKQGQGFRIIGKGEVQTEGEMVNRVKVEFPWARGALVIKIERTEALI